MKKARDIMTSPAASCSVGDSLIKAIRIMVEQDCGAVPVIGSGNCVAGVITDRDAALATYVNHQKAISELTVETAMSPDLRFCVEDDDLTVVRDLMQTFRVRRLPVLDAARTLKGIVSVRDLAREYLHGRAADRPDVDAEFLAETVARILEPEGGALPARDMTDEKLPAGTGVL